jgi:hypothetical protein
MQFKVMCLAAVIAMFTSAAHAKVVSVSADGSKSATGQPTYKIVCANNNSHRVYQKGSTWHLVMVVDAEITSSIKSLQEIAEIKCR